MTLPALNLKVSASEKQLFGHSSLGKRCCFTAISEEIA